MVLIDRAIGARAEFLNAWSVVERLLGRAPRAGDSFAAIRLGALGELLVVARRQYRGWNDTGLCNPNDR